MDMSVYEKMPIEELREEAHRLLMQLSLEERIEILDEVLEGRKQ